MALPPVARRARLKVSRRVHRRILRMTIIRFMALPMVQLWPMYHDGVRAGTGFFVGAAS